MGLLDQVLGKLSNSQQSATPASMSTMSPMVKGLLLLLATKAYHDYTTRRADQSAASNRLRAPYPIRRDPAPGAVSAVC